MKDALCQYSGKPRPLSLELPGPDISERCWLHGCHLIQRCAYCGAPVCCPVCCKEARVEVEPGEGL